MASAKKTRKPEADKKEVHFTVWVTREQEDQITRAAALDDEDKPSVWIRKLALRAARAALGEDKPTR